MRSFAGRDIRSLKGFERAEFEHVFQVADELEPIARSRKNADLLADKTLLTAFYQPSTCTRLATEAAMHRLGGHVLGFSDAKNTRAGDFYQESIKDTVHMLEYYGDVIAMRHFEQGAPAEAARWATVPVINCGDGWGEHPTQVLTDLYTTGKELGSMIERSIDFYHRYLDRRGVPPRRISAHTSRPAPRPPAMWTASQRPYTNFGHWVTVIGAAESGVSSPRSTRSSCAIVVRLVRARSCRTRTSCAGLHVCPAHTRSKYSPPTTTCSSRPLSRPNVSLLSTVSRAVTGRSFATTA